MSKDSNVVLIIEDEKELLEKHKKLVKSSGYIPMTASDGYTGLEVLTNNVGIVDLVLLDLFMSGLDGLEVLKAIKNNPHKYGDVPVIILTDIVNKGIIKEAFKSGAFSYLVKKEIDDKAIIEEIKKCI